MAGGNAKLDWRVRLLSQGKFAMSLPSSPQESSEDEIKELELVVIAIAPVSWRFEMSTTARVIINAFYVK